MTRDERTTRWVRINRFLLDAPKSACLSPPAFQAWILALCWSAEWDTGGRVPAQASFWISKTWITRPKRVLAELLERGVIEEDGDDHFILTDFSTYLLVPPKARAKPKRKPISARARFEVLTRDGFRCNSCGRHAKRDGVVLHVDHVHAVSKGGTNDDANLQTLCEDCNLGKAAR